MSISSQKNIGAYLHAEFAGPATSQTAGATSQVTTGAVIDRLNATYPVLGVVVNSAGAAKPSQDAGMELPLSCSLLFAVTATLVSGHTFSLAIEVDHGTTGSPTTSLFTISAATLGTVLTGVVAGTAQNAIVKVDVDLTGADEYLTVKYTPTFSATSADTCTVTPVWVFGGMNELP